MDYPPFPVEKPEKKDQLKYEAGTKTYDKRHPRQLAVTRDKNLRPETKTRDTRPESFRLSPF